MKETEPDPLTRPASPGEWNIEAAAASLRAEVHPVVDVVHGLGARLELTAMHAQLELFPERLVARYRNRHVQMEIGRVHSLTAEADGLHVELEDDEGSNLRFNPAGAIVFTRAAEVGRQASDEPPAATPPQDTSAQKEQERVTLVGRVGAAPSFRTSPKGVLIGRFPLAVRESEDKTTWHAILAFGQRATKVQETVRKGEVVEVVGYKHQREKQGRGGRPRTVEEVYAVVVKPR